MDKKSFSLIIVLLVITFSITLLIKYYRPLSAGDVDFSDFPLELGEWRGEREDVSQAVIDMLNPKDIFSATYTNRDGVKVHLLFDFFSSDETFGGPHSPRNCLPGSGWIILGSEQNNINVGSRNIAADRFALQFNQARRVMDFWYVTEFGETANDYVFKLHLLLSSLTFKPRDVAFVRFVTNDDRVSIAALADFQKIATDEIYDRLPFKK